MDTASNYRSGNLTAFDRWSTILVVTVPEIPALANTARCLEILVDQLEYGPEKVRLVLNRQESQGALGGGRGSPRAWTSHLLELPSDGDAAVTAINTGQPLTSKRSRSPLAEQLSELAAQLAEAGSGGGARRPTAWSGQRQPWRPPERVGFFHQFQALTNIW